MSLLGTWGAKEERNLLDETSSSKLQLMDPNELSSMLFEALRTIRNILRAKPSLLNAKLFGFEGHDVYEVVPDSKTKRCYTYTGQDKDGFFYPLHIAAEMGHKTLIILLVQAGADQSLKDYRNEIAEQKCNGTAQHAFYELRGLRFESHERYDGPLDRNGKRTKQGSLYYKKEGYHEEEHLLYRGGFRDNVYSGHGSLYWEGKNVLRYVGRFKDGLFHGIGTEMNAEGEKIYFGAFREGKRDGRGEEFDNGKLVYKGEFCDNVRHGFGMQCMAEGHRYLGRFDSGSMSGVGIYFHPNGDRFEGSFLKNKPDGHGSFYQKNSNGEDIVSHAQWSGGKKTKDMDVPFVAKNDDLPVTLNNNDEEESSDWRATIAKHIKLTSKDAQMFGVVEELHYDVEAEDDGEFDVHEFDDVTMYHFVENPALFVSYAYVCSAAKVFEARATTRDLGNIPDFERVYHAVIDAVDSYNEYWEREYKQSILAPPPPTPAPIETKPEEKPVEAKDGDDTPIIAKSVKDKVNDAILQFKKGPKPGEESPAAPVLTPAGGHINKLHEAIKNKKSLRTLSDDTQSKRLVFMSEAEKRDELRLKQKAELAAKNANALLDAETEKRIGKEVLEKLELELRRELEGEDDDGSTAEGQQEHDEEFGDGKNMFAVELLYLMRTATDILGY